MTIVAGYTQTAQAPTATPTHFVTEPTQTIAILFENTPTIMMTEPSLPSATQTVTPQPTATEAYPVGRRENQPNRRSRRG
jgi:hypothetical protein